MPVFNRYYLTNGQIGPAALGIEGPWLDVIVEIPPVLAQVLSAANQPIPAPQTGRALIDTGASISAIDAEIVRKLGVPPVGVVSVMTPSGRADQEMFPARILFPGTPLDSIDFTRMAGAQLSQQGLIALLGRDILHQCVFVYNGPGGHVSLSY